MRISRESLLLVIVTIVLSCASLSRGAFSWYDCGNPLGREIYYHSVDVYPESIVAGQEFAFNFAMEIDKFHVWEGNYLEIEYNGGIVYNVSTTNGCDVTHGCPYYPSSISYTDVFQTPVVPAGSYVVRITNVFGVDSFEYVIGCVQVTVDVVNSSPITTSTNSKCTYDSHASITLDGFPVYFQNSSNISIDDYIRVGPSSSWDITSQDPRGSWATFSSITSSSDLLFNGEVSDPTDYIWGLSANLLNNSESRLTYNGTFFVGYVGYEYPQFTDVSSPLLSGGIFLTIDYVINSTTNNIVITNADAVITIPSPLGSQPNNWPYILGFGRLSPLSLSYDGISNPIITGSSSINNTCTITTNNNTSESLVSGTSNQGSSQLSGAQKWSIGLGVGSALLLVIIAVLFYIAWKKGKRPLRPTDEDLVDPLKPDYGSQAINDIIDGSDDLPRV